MGHSFYCWQSLLWHSEGGHAVWFVRFSKLVAACSGMHVRGKAGQHFPAHPSSLYMGSATCSTSCETRIVNALAADGVTSHRVPPWWLQAAHYTMEGITSVMFMPQGKCHLQLHRLPLLSQPVPSAPQTHAQAGPPMHAAPGCACRRAGALAASASIPRGCPVQWQGPNLGARSCPPHSVSVSCVQKGVHVCIASLHGCKLVSWDRLIPRNKMVCRRHILHKYTLGPLGACCMARVAPQPILRLSRHVFHDSCLMPSRCLAPA